MEPRQQEMTVGTLRIVLIAMMAGMGIFAIVGIFLNLTREGDAEGAGDLQFLLYIVLAMAVAAVPAMFGLTKVVVMQAKKSVADLPDDEAVEVVVKQLLTLRLIRGAMTEGIGLFGGVVLLLGQWPALIIVVVALLALGMQIPMGGQMQESARRIVQAAKDERVR